MEAVVASCVQDLGEGRQMTETGRSVVNNRGTRRLRIAIVGAGAGGLCLAKDLLAAGIDDFVLLEKNDGVGGTWRLNRYPGCECDVQSALYSFSWAPKQDWSKPYGTQPEILAYLEGIAEELGILGHCRFNSEVTSAVWDQDVARWRLETSAGDVVEAEVVVGAVGMFREPSLPDIEGLESFGGNLVHSARWVDHDDDVVAGKRVAVVGSAASAIQLVPEVAKVAEQLHMFQRTANWVLPKVDEPYTEAELAHFREHPEIQLTFRNQIYAHMDIGMTFSDPGPLAEREVIGLAAMEVVEDPDVRAKLVPDHPFGCKRPLFSNNFYPTFNRTNVELVTEPIIRVSAEGVITADGIVRSVDTIVLATGFTTTRYLSSIPVTGRDGRRLDEAWADGAQAYVGMTTSGFPNLFFLYGPNTNNGSILTMLEAQSSHVVAQVQRLVEEQLAWVDVRPEAMASYNEEVQAAIAAIPVWQFDCNGYYRSSTGRIVTQWPFSMSEFARRAGTIDPTAFESAPLPR
jgi:cation diffusion facilitator CzcD-associated flavoprotein CzcO